MAELALQHPATAHISMAGIVAAGEPIEPTRQAERVEVPKSMLGRGDTFALQVKGSFTREERILSDDVVVEKQGCFTIQTPDPVLCRSWADLTSA